MDQARKILLLHQAETEPSSEAWESLTKAFQKFADLEVRNPESQMNYEDLCGLAENFDHVFLDLSLADIPSMENKTVPNLTFLGKKSFPWNNPEARSRFMGVLSRYSCLLVEETPPADLIRVLHLYLAPKRLAGATPLMEKGAVLLGEKVQSLEAVGSLMDKLMAYSEKMGGFDLKGRLFDLRQILSALLTEAFRQAASANTAYPTIDFQVGASRKKLAVNLRFPRGRLSLNDIMLDCLDERDLYWQQIWHCSDLLLVTHHLQYDEMEVMALLNRPERPRLSQFRSILFKTSEKSMKKDALTTAPPNYDFQILSQVKLSEQETPLPVHDAGADDIDFGNLPDAVVSKMALLQNENSKLKEKADAGERQVREIGQKLIQTGKEAAQRQNEVSRLLHEIELIREGSRKKLLEMERKLEMVASQKLNQAAGTDPAQTAKMQELVTKLEATIRAAENEKSQLNERLANEQKKLAGLEQKYALLYKEAPAKDKEINELKAAILKIKKDGLPQQKAEVSAGPDPAQTKLLKEAEARENVLKQELRKLTFKQEHHEKTVKAIQNEHAEKIKLMEKNLQAAKAKEIELLKKIDDLSAALKKASKAA